MRRARSQLAGAIESGVSAGGVMCRCGLRCGAGGVESRHCRASMRGAHDQLAGDSMSGYLQCVWMYGVDGNVGQGVEENS
eukprot:322196-Chlamydomonas_euryale.AAC.3